MAENNFRITALFDGRTEDLDHPEFIGEGLDTLETAREAAEDAIAYINAEYRNEWGEPQKPQELCEEVIITDADGNEIERVHA